MSSPQHLEDQRVACECCKAIVSHKEAIFSDYRKAFSHSQRVFQSLGMFSIRNCWFFSLKLLVLPVNMQCRSEKPILSLRNCCLYESDAALFAEYAWLNDACIAIYFEVLQTKADVIFRRVVVAEGCTTHSGEYSRALFAKDGMQGEQNEEQPREERGRQNQFSEGGKGESGTFCAESFHGRGDEEIGGQKYRSPASTLYAEREREKKGGVPEEKDVRSSFKCDNKKYGDEEGGICDREKRWFSNFTEEMLQRNDKWFHILSSLLLVKPNQQPDPSDIARTATQCTEERSKLGYYKYMPAFQIYEDRCTPVLFVDPCVAFWLTFSDDDDEVTAVLQGLHLQKRQVVLWPISDKQNLNAAGGSHWTLLVQVVQGVIKRDGAKRFSGGETDAKGFSAGQVHSHTELLCKEHTFFHLNSLSSGTSSRASVAAAERLQQQILAHLELSQRDKGDTKCTLERIKCICPQQNSADCGIYCLIYAEKILLLVVEWWANNDDCRLECVKGINTLEQHVCASDLPNKGTYRPFSLDFQEIQRVQPAEALAKREAIASLIDMLRYG